MRVDHHGASGRERGCRVAARDAERVGEVAGAEHGDRPDGDQHPTQVGPRRDRRVGVGGVDHRLDVAALLHHVGQQRELHARALELALEPCPWQACLATAQLVQLRAGGAQHAGGLAQQPHAKLLVAKRRG